MMLHSGHWQCCNMSDRDYMSREPEEDDPENPDEGDMDEHDDRDEVDCPYCGGAIREFAVMCPHCQNYLSKEDAPTPRKPTWIIVTVLLLIAMLAGMFAVFG